VPSRQATATLPPPRKPKVIPAADGAVSSDGRLARGERTRLRLAEALISLLNDGTPQPTAKAVAARAGVSLRLVFHHFEDIDAIYRAVIAVQAQRYWDHLKPIAPSLPLAERAERTARRRGRLYDAVAPVRRTSATLAPQSPDVAEWVATTNALLRSHITVTFAPELERAGSDRDDLLDALDVSASWEVWERLRSGQRLSRSAAQCVMARLLLDLLAPVAR
jgi:AcrR family transcriptional regulator